MKDMTESREFLRVAQMHSDLMQHKRRKPTRLVEDERAFRIACLQEELDEYKNSTTLVDDYDAMLDLIVFALGTIERMGLPFKQGFDTVMDANMTKQPGPNSKRDDFAFDLVKPDNFVPPEKKLRAIILEADEPKPQPTLTVTDEGSVVGNALYHDYMSKVMLGEQLELLPKNEMKFDGHKPRPSLVPIIPTRLINEVLEFGAQKYAADSWRAPDREAVEWSRTYDSVRRHLEEWYMRNDDDEESGLPHLAHAATQLLFLIEHTQRGLGQDNRYDPTRK
jgi:hypothetical protein